MRFLLIWICSLLLVSQLTFAQSETEEIPFNQQKEHRIGVGFAITGFNSNFTYFVSPHYSFRYHRHWFGFTPFYGRLDALPKQQDIAIGMDYRLYPFKNLNSTLLYFPVGTHYNYKWTDRSQKNAMFYKLGFGVEALLRKHFALSLDASFGVGHVLTSEVQQTESSSFGSANPINFYFLPTIRLSYGL
ncbi:MAG: hypothetical protein H6601_02945 [Flavobacteriales bacterium]|nr:hypothetical protein [Flavobacteriales bacterium]